MEQYRTDAEIYAVLEREIIDLTIRPGSSLSENPLCARFGAPRSLIRVVLQKLQENGLVRIVPYKGTTVTRLNRRIVDELIYERTAVEARILRDFAPQCTPEQRALIRRRVEAYAALLRSDDWIYGRRIPATQIWKRSFPWGNFELRLVVRQGLIREARVVTDMLDSRLPDVFAAALKGEPCLPERMVKAARKAGGEDFAKDITGLARVRD